MEEVEKTFEELDNRIESVNIPATAAGVVVVAAAVNGSSSSSSKLAADRFVYPMTS